MKTTVLPPFLFLLPSFLFLHTPPVRKRLVLAAFRTAAHNIFQFTGSGSLAGTINGGSATGNWLDYQSVRGPVKVNLSGSPTRNVPADSASNVHGGLTGGISNIQNVLGSSKGGDTLIGCSLGSILVGHNTGNTLVSTGDPSLLIGGSGSNTLIGGLGDLLIVGSTSYDKNETALSTIFANLQNTATPFTRAALNAIENNPLLPLQVGKTVFLSKASASFQLAHVTAPGDDWIFTEVPSSFPPTTPPNFFN
jgi:hypothetical protein